MTELVNEKQLRLGIFQKPLSGFLEINANQYLVKSIQILAKKRSGKSYLAGLIAEQLMENDFPIVVIDPIGAHWGLREKFNIVIMGDPDLDRVDIPIFDEPKKLKEQGKSIATYTAYNKQSVLLDLSHMSEPHQQTFSAEFFQTLYKLNQERRHLFVEETDVFAPQIAQWDEVLHSRHQLDNLVRRGGQKGIGTTVITQRPALVSKNILTQSDLTIVMNIIAPQDMKAIMDVIKFETWTKEVISDWRERFKRLKVGEAYFYSPQWLGIDGVVTIDERTTYHAGSTLGDPGWRKSQPSLVTLPNLKELKAGLIGDRYLGKNNPNRMASNTPEEFITKEITGLKAHIDAQDKIISTLESQVSGLNEEVIQKKKEIEGWKTDLTTQVNMFDNLNSRLASYDKLKDALNEIIPTLPKLQPKVLEVDNLSEIVIKETPAKDMYISESTLQGKLLYLVTSGFFNEPQKIAQIQEEMYDRWTLPVSERPGGSNVGRFRKKLLAELDVLTKRPHELLQDGGDGYMVTLNAIDRIRTAKPDE